jgi:hypothetical protein
MTRARTDGARGEPAGPPITPYSIDRRRRCQLRRLGRCDGRFAMPDPHSGKGPLTTAAREQLRAEHDRQVTDLWATHCAEHTTPDRMIEEINTALESLQQAAEQTLHRLETARQSPPDPHNPQYTPGERSQGRPPEFVIARRTEEYQDLLRTLEAEHKSATDKVDDKERQRSALQATAARRLRAVVLAEHRLIATFMYERNIYDIALLRRHPLRTQVAPKLDGSVPELSPWARAALNELGE